MERLRCKSLRCGMKDRFSREGQRRYARQAPVRGVVGGVQGELPKIVPSAIFTHTRTFPERSRVWRVRRTARAGPGNGVRPRALIDPYRLVHGAIKRPIRAMRQAPTHLAIRRENDLRFVYESADRPVYQQTSETLKYVSGRAYRCTRFGFIVAGLRRRRDTQTGSDFILAIELRRSVAAESCLISEL
ncbi:hypothetical protein EVAR_26413_1 [Eumeta japonica]|uniref:Uncharacterized protein n=1 Tax=Eumeta variegata TaxID=151549 RepID=A0A4C1VQD1_EUMVA|nr:hypothetical protein EVAR_26413_1 [Eumeta japonica]